jgi:ABC-type uncharacterized transport system substrate-binding protein
MRRREFLCVMGGAAAWPLAVQSAAVPVVGRPAELPVQAPIKFEMVVNLKTAKALGLSVPESFLGKAELM